MNKAIIDGIDKNKKLFLSRPFNSEHCTWKS